MKFRKTRISILTLAMFVVAGAMFAFGALNFGLSPYITSNDLQSQFKLDHIGVNLFENGTPVEKNGGKLLAGYNGKIAPGKTYTEEIYAYNSSDVKQYVRVIVRKYWMSFDKETNKYVKDSSLDSSLIKLTYGNDDYNTGSWMINDQETTTETKTYYYLSSVDRNRSTSQLFNKLQIDGVIASESLEGNDYMTRDEKPNDAGQTVITYTYKYDGKVVCIEAEAQALQPHNINDAIKSVWGVQNVTVSGDTLSVGQ